ncbi:cation-translocating P-type ATPase [Kitasatospora sp. NPDC052896]|uniref:cation-translocating P-type ATPase n=1 Tax=Kitasatospora sp. NPDC052896 TaxID=3364061 RepID=UPI0037CA6AF5
MPESGARLLPLVGRSADAVPRRGGEPGRAARLGRLPLLRELDSSPRGLTEAEAEARLALHGENTVLPRPDVSWSRHAATALGDPFTVLLTGLAGICALIGSWGSAAILGFLVLSGALLRLVGERRSSRALRALRALVPETATVLRRAERQDLPMARELPADQLVPGDVVRLAVGDAVPADLRLLRAEGLTVDQSALTGESEPVARWALDQPPAGAAGQPFDEPHLCFAGSRVVTGSATAVVLATGGATRFGAAHRPAPLPGGGRSAVEHGVRRAVRALVLFMIAAVPLTVGADAVLHGWSAELLPFAVAAAVGLTPELLPLVLSTVLARGSHDLTAGGVPVRRLSAVSELGALDVLCVDKTGTLTTGAPVVAGSFDPDGRPDPRPLYWAGLSAEAAFGDGDPGLPDPTDELLLDAAAAAGLLDGPAPVLLDAVPFDPVRRCATVLLRERGRAVLLVKGAPEAVLARCAEVTTAAGPRALDQGRRAELDRLVATRAGEGLRLLAVARAERAARLGGHRAWQEDDLTLLGFVALAEEPVDRAAEALAALARAGVAVKVVTGDHPATAVRLADRLGLPPGRVLIGSELDALTDGELAEAAGGTAVFARCAPEQKARVVLALRRGGGSVGFLGDGVNDVPALRAADLGISASGAVGAARGWADAVLGEDGPSALVPALWTGRAAVAKVAAYLRIALSCNLGNAASMLAGGVLLPFLPMLPAQVLLQNLCFDAAQLSFALAGSRGGRSLGPARLRWGTLGIFAVVFGLLNSLADIGMFEAMREVTDGFRRAGSAAAFHTAFFTENLVTQALALLVLYGLDRAGVRPPRPVWWAAGVLTVAGVLLPGSPLGKGLGFEGLPAEAYGPLALVVAGYAGLLLCGRALWRRWAAGRE